MIEGEGKISTTAPNVDSDVSPVTVTEKMQSLDIQKKVPALTPPKEQNTKGMGGAAAEKNKGQSKKRNKGNKKSDHERNANDGAGGQVVRQRRRRKVIVGGY